MISAPPKTYFQGTTRSEASESLGVTSVREAEHVKCSSLIVSHSVFEVHITAAKCNFFWALKYLYPKFENISATIPRCQITAHQQQMSLTQPSFLFQMAWLDTMLGLTMPIKSPIVDFKVFLYHSFSICFPLLYNISVQHFSNSSFIKK